MRSTFARAALPLMLVALMAAPPWLDAAAQSPLPVNLPNTPALPPLPQELNPLEALLEDLQGFLGQAPEIPEQLVPGDGGLPGPGGLQQLANRTLADLQSDAGNLTNGPIRTLFYEGFEGSAGLAARGWSQEVVRGRAPWGVADAVNGTVLRMDGSFFTPEFESGEPQFVIKDGAKAATILNAQGRYDARVDARLISPIIDLRYVVGASQRTQDPYDLLTTDPTVGEPYRLFLDVWQNSIRQVRSPGNTNVYPYGMLNWLVTTPPNQIQRLAVGSSAVAVPCDVGFFLVEVPCGYPGEALFVNPLHERYGAALVNLTFYHRYDLNTGQSATIEDSYLDGVFLEARVLRPDGTVGPWEHLFGDAVFEPNVNRNHTVFLVFPDPESQGFDAATFPLSSFQPPVSGSVEMVQDALSPESSEYTIPDSWYTGRVQMRPYSDCGGFLPTSRVDCLPDVPAFVAETSNRVKSHFTLNRFAGHQIQLAWRVHSAAGSITADTLGWFVDAVKVEALLPQRDPGVEKVDKPRSGDLVPTTALLQPEAVIKNYGYQDVEGVRVNFTIIDDVPELTPEQLQALLQGDTDALVGAVSDPDVPPTVPGVPGGTLGGVMGQTRQPRVLLRSSTVLERLGPLESRVVQSSSACVECGLGAYRLLVEVTTLPLSGGEPGSLPTDRIEDGSRANNAVDIPFEVRDVPRAEVQLNVAPASVLTDINEAKTLRLDLLNTGNRDLTGTVDVGARLVDPDTREPAAGAARIPVGAFVVTPGALPAGKRLSGFGADRDRLTANLTWSPTNLAPGVYLLDAVFRATPALLEPATDVVNAFIRTTPTAYFPGDGRAREDFEVDHDLVDFFSPELPPYAEIGHIGWRTPAGGPNAYTPRPLAQGAVSLNHTWNATAADGPLIEFTVLSLLAPGPGVVGSAPAVTNMTFELGPASVTFPNLTFDPDRGEVRIPPIVVSLPRLEARDFHDPSRVLYSVPPQEVATEAQTIPVNATAPNATLTLPPALLRTEPFEVNQGGFVVSAPATLVRIDSMVLTVFPRGPEPAALRATVPRVIIDVPSFTIQVPSFAYEVPSVPNPVSGGATPPVTGTTPPVNVTTPPVSLDTQPSEVSSPATGPAVTSGVAQSLPATPLGPAGGTPGLSQGGPFHALVRADDVGLKVCVNQPGATTECGTMVLHNYTEIERVLSNQQQWRDHSFLNDYYLTREVDLSGCTGSCRPFLSYWYLGNFSWTPGAPESVSTPGALGGPLGVPTGIQAVSPDQSGDRGHRGLVEITVLDDGGDPRLGVGVRGDVLPEEGVLPPGAPVGDPEDPLDLCAIADAMCQQASAACVQPGLDPGDPLGLPLIGQAFPDILDGQVCPSALRRPVDDASVVAEYRKPMPTWRQEVIPLDGYAGTRIQLTFHYQTTLGKINTNRTTTYCYADAAKFLCQDPNQNWALDNIRVFGVQGSGPASGVGFFDTAGDREGDEAHREWMRLRQLREIVDENVLLSPACYGSLNQPIKLDAPGPVPPDPAACGQGFQGLTIGVDGRGWDIWTAGADIKQKNGFENPFYDGWFLDSAAGFQLEGAEDLTRATALRWGGPGTGGTHPPYDSYNIATTRLLSLAATARPFAEFQLNYSFSRAASTFEDGGTVFLARYHRHCAEGEAAPCPVVFDRRAIVVPEGGFPGSVKGKMSDPTSLAISWDVTNAFGAPLNNGFEGRSGTNPRHSTYVPVRIDLAQALERLCLMAVTQDGLTAWLTHDPNECRLLHENITFDNGQGVHRDTGFDYRKITAFEQDPGAFYALEFHTQNQEDAVGLDFGMAVDDLRIAEQFLANDLSVSRVVFPEPGKVIGPGEVIPVRINVTNHGLFAQRGVRLHFNVTQQGAQVFPVPQTYTAASVGEASLAFTPSEARPEWTADEWRGARVLMLTGPAAGETRQVLGNSNVSLVLDRPWAAGKVPVAGHEFDLRYEASTQVTPLGTVIPGLRDTNPQKNVSFTFENPWIPQSEGVFTLNTWVEILGEFVGGQLVPLEDENRINDRRVTPVEVRKVHSVRLLPGSEMPDESVVVPLVATTEDRRVLRVVLENLGTVSQGQSATDFVDLNGNGKLDPVDSDGDGRLDEEVPRHLRVSVHVTDEAGNPVPAPDPRVIDLVLPGKTIPAEFVWRPPSGGLFTLRFTAESDLDLVKDDNERVVKVLVLTRLIPPAGQPWHNLFSAEGTGWHNDSRFDPAAVWSFGSRDTYGPLQEGSLVLDLPVDLTDFRNAVLTLRHRYAFEKGYDGGVIEISADGHRWDVVAPLRTTDEEGNVLFDGYPAALTTASTQVPRPGDVVRAFTGDSGGVVTSVVPLGTADITRSDPVVLFQETFDPAAVLAGADLAEARGQWVEVRGKSGPPGGKAWWVDKTLPWRMGQIAYATGIQNAEGCQRNGDWRDIDAEVYDLYTGSAACGPLATFEGTKTLYIHADGTLTIPRLDAPLVVEFDEWRGFGLSRRGDDTCQSHYCAGPNAIEVTLQRLAAGSGNAPPGPDFNLTVLPRSADATVPYGDNHLEWTRRSIVLPSSQVRHFLDKPARLAFQVHGANSNAEDPGTSLLTDLAPGTGKPDDTDFLSAHLGWALASPSLYFITSAARCAEAAPGAAYRDGRCILFEDGLGYGSSDEAAAQAHWTGAWETLKHNRTIGDPLVLRSQRCTANSTGHIHCLDAPSDDALVEGGWRLVDAVRLVTDKPVWDTATLAPQRTGRARIAEATGSGVDSRLITPLNLRAAASDVTLRLDHSFKFSDLTYLELSPPMTITGGVSGARLEVSRDGGETWEPLAPKVPLETLGDGEVDRLAYTRALGDLHFQRTFLRGAPPTELQCQRPSHAGCLDPAEPFRPPGGWTGGTGSDAFTPLTALSAHTPFGGTALDPEANSALGLDSLAFAGTTCLGPKAEPADWCGGAEDWQHVEFDLTPYAGQEVLLGFHAFFSTHRYVSAEHNCTGGEDCPLNRDLVVPRDFWRVDNVTVETRVLDGKPFFVRLRGFSDANGEAYGWDVHNITLLGDRHVRNLGVRIQGPVAGEPLFGSTFDLDARVVNRGQEPLRARGTLIVEPAALPQLRSGGFEDGNGYLNWTLERLGAGTKNISTNDAAEGKQALRFEVSPSDHEPLRLSQTVRVPAGHWRLVGLASVGGAGPGTMGVQLLGARDDAGRSDPTLAFPRGAGVGKYTPFEVPFVVEGESTLVTVTFLASRNLFGDFSGAAHLDHVRLEPRPPPGEEPPATGLFNGGFESGLEGWTVDGAPAAVAGESNLWTVKFHSQVNNNITANATTVQGAENATFVVGVPNLNVTNLEFNFVVNTTLRAAAQQLNVAITQANGTSLGPYSFPLPPGVETGVPNLPRLPVPVQPIHVNLGPADLTAKPADFDVAAASREEALADPLVPPPFSQPKGTWTVRFNITTNVNNNAELSEIGDLLNVGETQVTLKTTATHYHADAVAKSTAGGVANVAEGIRAAVVASRGRNASDFQLSQDLALEPGKYRLEGLFASRGLELNLTPNLAAPDKVSLTTPDQEVVQELDPRDLPPRITSVVLYSPNSVSVAVSLTDPHGHVLGSATPTVTNGQAEASMDVLVPQGLDKLLLKVRRNTANIDLEVHPGDTYSGGVLRNVSNPEHDLRMTFKGPVETRTARTVLAVAGGSGAANSAGPAGDAVFELNLTNSMDYHVRQVVIFGNTSVRRVTNVEVQVRFPGADNQMRTPANASDLPLNFSLRQGQVRAQLFDLEGTPVSEEATFLEHTKEPATGGSLTPESIDPEVKTLNFAFTNAFLPPDAAGFQVGLRAVNFTLRPVQVRTVAHPDTFSPETHLEDGWLQVRGEPWFYSLKADPNQTTTPPSQLHCTDAAVIEGRGNNNSWFRHGCDIPLEITALREGSVVIDVPGAQGQPVILTQPTAQPSTFATQQGYVPFRLDFVVQPGQDPVTVRLRGDQWQGDAVFDGLRITPLTRPAVVFQSEVLPGREAPLLLENGTRPQVKTLRGASYAIIAEAAVVDGEGRVLGEIVLGDNRATVRTGAALGPGQLLLAKVEGDPNSVNLTTGERAAIVLVVKNTGAEEAELLRASGVIATKAGQRIVEFTQGDFDPIPENLTFAPLEERVLRWPYQPDPTLAHGVYLLSAEVATQPLGDEEPAVSKASSLLYLGTDFHSQAFQWPFHNVTEEDALLFDPDNMPQNPEGMDHAWHWTMGAAYNKAYPPRNECDPVPDGASEATGSPCLNDRSEAQVMGGPNNWRWTKTDELNLSAYRSLTLGGDSDAPVGWIIGSQGQAGAGTVFAVLRSKSIAITDMQRPQLLYADRHEFNGIEAEGSIFARLVNQSDSDMNKWTVFPTGPCLSPDNIRSWGQVDDHISGRTPGYTAGKWISRSVDLGPLIDRAVAETGTLEQWTHVQLCWHLEQPSVRTGANLIREWSIDDVLLTPYGMALGPGQRIPITDNVSKDFRLVLRNNGAYTDTYRLSLEEETGLESKGPSHWKLSVRDEDGRPIQELRVAPGQERIVTLRVEVAVAPPTLAREGAVDLALTAISKTTSFLRSTQHLLFEFTYEDRPNLRVAGLIVNDATLSVDKPRTVDVLVQNTGGVTARNVGLAVVDKMDPSFGVAPEELRQLDGTPIPPQTIAPGDTKVVTVNWIPRVAGEHNVTAIVDPEARLLEFDERDNVLVKPIVVPAAEFPDLLVEASASTANPGPGDLVEVTTRITNKGGAPATGIQVSLRAGVTDLLPGEPPHVLPFAINPGETHVLNASWRPAFPGEQTIIIRARTFAGVLERLDTSGDNVVLLVIKVRSRGLDLVLPPDLVVEPGTLANATIEVHNRGDVDDTYRIRLEPPDDWRGQFLGLGEDVRLSVANHTHRTLTVQLGPPRHAESGAYQVRLLAESENGTEALEAHLVASIPQAFGIRFELQPEYLLQPGARLLPLTLRNLGNGLDLVTVRARSVPEGWSVEPTTFGVAPRATEERRVNLTSPSTTPEGVYDLVLEAQGKGGDLLAQATRILILPYELLRLEVQGVPEVLVPGSAHEGSLVVRNGGNVPARASVALQAPPGWALDLERDVVQVNPGEARSLDLGLVVPANASSRPLPLVARAVSGRDATYELTQVLRPAGADLAVVAVDQLPRGQVRDGATLTLGVTVANRGEVALPTPLAVYVDDALLGYENGPLLGPGEEARINLTVRARGGEHVVLVVADPAGVLGEEDETNNARLLVLRVDRAAGLFAVPGPEPLLAALALVGLALILRKRNRPPGPGHPGGPWKVDR